MCLSSADQHSLHSEGLTAVLVRSTNTTAIKMKYFVFFFLCFVALTSAAPQLIWPGYVGPAVGPLGVDTRTVVAGPTVVNGFGLGGRLIAPGFAPIL